MSSRSSQNQKTPNNTASCPLCGGPNLCALASDPSATDCWCSSVEFPQELLAKIPENAVRKFCVCQKCLEEFNESGNLGKDYS